MGNEGCSLVESESELRLKSKTRSGNLPACAQGPVASTGRQFKNAVNNSKQNPEVFLSPPMSDAEQTVPLNEQSASHLPLLLEAPPEGSSAQKLDLGSGQTLRFDALGPVVVNSNGVRMQRSLSSYPTHAVPNQP